eukprot:1042875_1
MTRIARTLILLILISGTPIIHCAQDPNDLHGNYKNNPSSPSSPKHHGARFGYHENQGSSTNLQGAQGLYTENDTDTVSSSSNYETPEPVALLEKKHKFKHAEPFVGKAKHLDPTVFQSMKKLFGPTQVPTDKQLTISETNIARPFHSPIRASHATPEITENIRNSPSQSDKSQSSTSSYVSQSVSELDLSEDNHALNTGDSDKSLSSMPEAAEAYDCAQSNDSHLCNISINVGTKLTGPPYNTDEVEGSGDHSLTTAEIEASMYEEHEEKAALLQSSTVKAHNNNAYNPANQGNTYSDDDAQNNDGYNPANQGNTFSDDDADGEQDDIDTDDIIVPKYDDFVPKDFPKSLTCFDRNHKDVDCKKHKWKYAFLLLDKHFEKLHNHDDLPHRMYNETKYLRVSGKYLITLIMNSRVKKQGQVFLNTNMERFAWPLMLEPDVYCNSFTVDLPDSDAQFFLFLSDGIFEDYILKGKCIVRLISIDGGMN